MSYTSPYRQHNYMGEFANDTAADSGIPGMGLGSPQNGVYYYNTTDHKYRARFNGAWADLGGGSPGGSDTQFQFNDSNVFGGAEKVTWDKTNYYIKLGTLTRILTGGITSHSTTAEGTAAGGIEGYLRSSGGDYSEPFLKFRSEGVGHGVTTLAPTDCFFFMKQAAGGGGGVQMTVFTDSSSYRPIEIKGVDTTGDTTTGTFYQTTRATFNFNASESSGTGNTSLGSSDNLVIFANDDYVKWLMKGNGDLYGVGKISLRSGGTTFESSPDCSTGGMTLNQTNDTGPHVTLKGTGIQSASNVYDSDTYCVIRRISGTNLGLGIQGLSSSQIGLSLVGSAGNPDTTTSTAGVGPVNLDGRGVSSNSWAALSDSENLLSVRNYSTTRIIVKGSGRAYWLNGGIDLRTVGSTANAFLLPNTSTGETGAVRYTGTFADYYDGSEWTHFNGYTGLAITDGVGSPYSIPASATGKIFTNSGATEKSAGALPTAVAGLAFTFYVINSYGFRIIANSGDTIRKGSSASPAAGYIESTAVGDAITLVAIDATQWVVISSEGSGWAVSS